MKMLLWPFFGSTLCAFATWRTVLVGPSLFRTQLRFGLNKSKISYPEPDCQTMSSYHCLIGKTVVKVDTNLRLEPKVINRTIWLIIKGRFCCFPWLGSCRQNHISDIISNPTYSRPVLWLNHRRCVPWTVAWIAHTTKTCLLHHLGQIPDAGQAIDSSAWLDLGQCHKSRIFYILEKLRLIGKGWVI